MFSFQVKGVSVPCVNGSYKLKENLIFIHFELFQQYISCCIFDVIHSEEL